MVRSLAITLLLVALPALASDVLTTIPAQFLGTWTSSLEKCGSYGDDSMLRLESEHISYWESSGSVKTVVVRENNEIAMIAELSGEGETWLGTLQLKLSPDGSSLIDEYTVPGEQIVRYRCPSSTGPRSSN